MRALVTGATGFIGANLVRRLLADGFQTVALVRPGSKNLWRIQDLKDKVQIIFADLLKPDEVDRAVMAQRPDFFFHLACYGAYPFQKEVEKILKTNLFGAVNLLQAARRSGFKKFIATGSSSEYGRKDQPMRESDRLEPETAYGVSKAAATLYLTAEAKTGRLPVVIFRPFSVYGPWEEPSRLLPTIIKKALAGESLELVSPEIARDYFVYVDDIVAALMRSLDNQKVDGQTVNLCSGVQATIKEVVQALLKVTKSKSQPLWGAYGGRSYDTTIWLGEPGKAKRLLGWEPKIKLEQGITKMVNWFKTRSEHYR